jgi:hypothetical protein
MRPADLQGSGFVGAAHFIAVIQKFARHFGADAATDARTSTRMYSFAA